MTISTLLVHVDATKHSNARVQVAGDLAKRLSARLTGLYVIEPDPIEVVLPVDVDFGGVASRARARSGAQETQREAHFKGCLQHNAIRGDWHLAHGQANVVVSRWARRADLAVVGQSDPDDLLDDASAVATHALLEAGRPILVVPYAGRFDTVGTNIVVAWKESRESARALADALPLLQHAETVTVLAVNPSDENGFGAGQGIMSFLAEHGIAKAQFTTLNGLEISAGEIILNRCFDLGADLLVTGGYGHSPGRERILGGVTRTLFEQMTLPVLMSH